MKTRNKVTMLVLAATAFSVGGLVALPSAEAKADTTATPAFYMEAGAAVNITDETYGGIRWTTVVEEGYVPVDGASAENVSFGTFVVPTATYESAAAGTEIKDMVDVVDVVSATTGADALNGNVTYYSAIKYDDILADYMEANNLTSLTEAEETELLKEAYQMELTAVSYALYEDTYYYATAVETSRSARQVANIAILRKDLEKEEAGAEKTEQIKSYVETGADSFARTQLDNTSEGYLDLTELSASEAVAQEIDVSGLNGVDFATGVAEIVIGANKLTADDYTYADGTLSLEKGSAALVAGEETWLSIFTTDGNVHSLPVIPATGVIRTAQQLNDTFGVKNQSGVNDSPLYGYYVLGNDITGGTDGSRYEMSLTDSNGVAYLNGGTTRLETIVDDGRGGFYGTFDGRGHTISKISTRMYGIFGWLINATVKNIAFTKIEAKSNNSNANQLLAYYSYNSTFENVYVDMAFERSNGNSVISTARASTFTNFVLNVNEYRQTTSNKHFGLLGSAYSWAATNGGNNYCDYVDNTFTNVYMISDDCMIMENGRTENTTDGETIKICVDGANWATPTVGTSVNYTESNIKRYLSVEDMFDNVYYNADGSVNESATKTENNWTAFDSTYWDINTTNKTISWK